MKEYPPFYIGQKVVALSTCTDKFRVKGKIYTVLNIIRKPCKCGNWVIDIGDLHHVCITASCCICGAIAEPTPSRIIWHAAACFAPIIEDMQAVTFEKIAELEPVSIN